MPKGLVSEPIINQGAVLLFTMLSLTGGFRLGAAGSKIIYDNSFMLTGTPVSTFEEIILKYGKCYYPVSEFGAS